MGLIVETGAVPPAPFPSRPLRPASRTSCLKFTFAGVDRRYSGDGDSLRRSIDEFSSQLMLLTDEEYPREQVRQGSRKKPHPNPFLHPCMPLCASSAPLVESAPAASYSSVSQIASCSNHCLMPMFGSSLGISSSRCAQRAANRLPQTRQWRAREFRSCERTAAHERGHDGVRPPA